MGRRAWIRRVGSALPVLALCLAGAACSGDAGSDDAGPSASPGAPVAPTSPAVPLDGGRLSSELDAVLASGTGTYENLRAVLVYQDGRPLVRLHYGRDSRRPANVMSVTKSVVGTLVGIAEGEGLLRRDDTLADLLPSYADRMNDEMAGTTLEQVLTMTAGLPADPDVWPAYRSEFPGSDDWVASIVEKGITGEPGTFAYSSLGSHLLAAVLTEATGTSVLDYARRELLGPLGIDTAEAPALQLRAGDAAAYVRAGHVWPTDPTGVNLGYAWLKLSAADLVKLGQLYLQGGRWKGEQVVPEEWVRAATTNHLEMLDVSGMGYGYQWWTGTAADRPAYFALGFGGQLIEVVPDLSLVVVATSDVRDPLIGPASLAAIVDDTVALQLAD
ncbi:class C beta-lactamase-related serine hydrolase [Nocardioides guangzhouensis]|uniref:Class C beta-lactamase-related serine hydrolase n=1 Tax=Nocardioides guangzhouensis TaxID=2497878 RepID=A0A4V1XZJ0_9ACTN|nr:serine hydrolase [Nocardioides guangzhouensis]RYP86919.1 class C beta-lactamase-related serine hydrolase [Nocardioides guangzhouensis]